MRGAQAAGWLVDRSGSLEEVVAAAWAIASGQDATVPRPVAPGPLAALPDRAPMHAATGDAAVDAARQAIYDTVVASTGVPLDDAVDVQSKHSAEFFAHGACRRGVVGTAWRKTTKV